MIEYNEIPSCILIGNRTVLKVCRPRQFAERGLGNKFSVEFFDANQHN